MVLVIGTFISLIESYETLCIGRYIYGLGAGSFSVFCPLFVTETSPIEVSGPLGANTEIGISIGLLLVDSIGMGMGDTDFAEEGSFEI